MSQIRVDEITDEAGTGAPEITDHYKKSNILGTVSESGGVPTGAIIERGSNSNGEYVKYADGAQICWQVQSISPTADAGWGGLQRSTSAGGATWTYPVSFSAGNPAVFADDGRYDTLGYVRSSNNNNASLGIISDKDHTKPISSQAIGRWY